MKQSARRFVLCIENADYKASLILGKVYPLIADRQANKDDLVRIVDESGEDYLYDKSHFVFVEFPPEIAQKILGLAALSDPVLSLGREPIVDDANDASVEHDRYIYHT